MRFSVLGLVGISDGTDTVVLPPSKPSSLLAALLLRPNQSVSIDFLQHVVWGEHPPSAAKATLQTYILRLRRLFRTFGISDNAIETVPNGYRFPASSDTLDLVEFRDLVRAAHAQRGQPDELATLERALALWQGPPLSNIQSTVLHRDEVPELVEEWLRLSERRFEVALDLGRHREIAAELRAATRAHPGYERFWEQLIEALYRAGRQADALREYASIKRFLCDELGVDPGPGLQRLELAILRGEELPQRSATGSPPSRARTSTLSPLPPDLPRFAGRRREVEALVEQLTAPRTGPLVVAISGPPGVGKSALAVHVAHLAAEHFPHGAAALDPGADGGAPPDFGGLLLIDAVTSADQVAARLPTAPGSATIVVSRGSLVGLVAARGGYLVRLGALSPSDSAELLTAARGPPRIAEEPAAAVELAELCGHFPATLRIALSRLTAGRHTIADCVEWLRPDPVRKLSLTSDRGLSPVNAFNDHLSGVNPIVVDAFLRLALASGEAQLPVPECAEVLGLTPAEAEHLLEHMVDASLVEIGSAGRYVMYPLVRRLARAVGAGELVTR